MARKRKLNKRVVILLAAMGGVIVFAALAVYLQRLPEDPVAAIQQGQEALDRKDYAAAERHFRVAVQNASEGQSIRSMFLLARTYLDWARTAADLTDTDRTEYFGRGMTLLRKVLFLDAKYEEAQHLMCDIAFEAALQDRRRWNLFISEADKLLAISPKDHKTYFRRALGYGFMAETLMGEYPSLALADFRKAVEIAPNEPNYWIGMCAFLRNPQLDRADEAEKTFLEGIKANPDSAELRVAYAGFLSGKKRDDEALVQYRETIQRNPKSTTGKIELAGFYARQRKYAEAVQELQAAREIDDSDYRIYRDLALVYKDQVAPDAPPEARRAQLDRAIQAFRDGLAVVDRRLKPISEGQMVPEMERRRLTDARWRLNYMLSDILLDACDVPNADVKALLSEARDCLGKLEKLAPKTPQVDKIAGRIALAEGRTAEGLTLLERAMERFRFDPEIAGILINQYLALDLPGKAEALIDQFLDMPGAIPSRTVLLAKIRLLMRRHEFDKAERIVTTRLLQKDPADQEARNVELALKVLKGKPPEIPPTLKPSKMVIRLVLDRADVLWIEDYREKAVEVVENLYGAIARNEPEMVDELLRTASRLASFYAAMKQDAKAKAFLESVIQRFPENKELALQRKLLDEPDPKKQLEMRLSLAEEMPPMEQALYRANTQLLFGDAEKYLAELQKAAKIDPEAPGVVEGLFRSAVAAKDWTLAESYVDRAIKGNIDGAEGQTYIARLAMAKEDYPKAIAALTAATRARPELKSAWLLLGDCYVRANDLENAYEAYRIVLSSDPSYVPAQIAMAKVCETLGKTAEWAQYVREAYQTSDGARDSYIRNRYLVLEAQKGKPEEIQDIIARREVILGQNPSDLENRLRLGRLYEAVGQTNRAEEMYRYIYQNNRNRVDGARILVEFLTRTQQSDKVEKVVQELSATEKDKVGVLLLYAGFLAQYSLNQAQNVYQQAAQMDPNDPRVYLEMGRFLAESSKKWDEASAALEKYCQLRPEDLASQKQLIYYLIEAEHFDPAVKRLNHILAADPSDAQALTLKGLLMIKRKNYSGARELLEQAAKENPRYPIPLVYLAQVDLDTGDVKSARTRLQAVTKLTNSPEIMMQLALVYMRVGEFEDAQATLRAVLDSQPDYAPAIRLLISLYQQGKKWRRLELLLEEAQKRFPNDATYRLQEIEMWLRRLDPARALLAAEKARKQEPESWPVLVSYLTVLLENKSYDKVLAVCEPEITKKDKRQPRLLAIQARALAGKNQETQADELFVKAITDVPAVELELVVREAESAYGLARTIQKYSQWASLRPKDWQASMLLGDMYRRSEDLPQAVAHLRKALDLATDSTDKSLVHRALGAAYHAMGGKDPRYLAEAEQHYRAAIAQLPRDTRAMNNLAYLYANDLNKPLEALDLIERVFKADPNEPRIADTYGWTLAKLGRYKLAEEILLRSVQLGDPMAANRYHLGWVYEQTERPGAALNLYKQSLELARQEKDETLTRLLSEGINRLQGLLRPKE